jgi:hypothetical protein
MIFESRAVEMVFGVETTFDIIFWVTSTGVVSGEMSGIGTLKLAESFGAVITVVGMETVWVGISTVCCCCGGGGGGGDGGTKVFAKSSVGAWNGGKMTNVATMRKRIKWNNNAPKKYPEREILSVQCFPPLFGTGDNEAIFFPQSSGVPKARFLTFAAAQAFKTSMTR